MSFARRAVALLCREGLREFVRSGLRYLREQWDTSVDRARARARSIRQRYRWGRSAPDAYQLRYVDPASISHVVAPGFHVDHSRAGTHIKGGDWDRRITDEPLTYHGKYDEAFDEQQLVPFENFVLYDSVVEHADHGVPWEETEFYQWALVDRKHDSWRFKTREAVKDRFAYMTQLYRDMKREGYKTQTEFDDSPMRYPPEYDEVLVDVGRDGRLFLDDGRHRLCFAKVLGFDSIPVRVFVRHEQWQRLRKRVATEGIDPRDVTDTIEPDHPDLRDVSSPARS